MSIVPTICFSKNFKSFYFSLYLFKNINRECVALFHRDELDILFYERRENSFKSRVHHRGERHFFPANSPIHAED